MAEMGAYCKAYPVARLQEFPEWGEKPVENPSQYGDLEERILFIQENYVVTDGIFKDENIVFDQVTPGWIEFCKTRLDFQIPELDVTPAGNSGAVAQT